MKEVLLEQPPAATALETIESELERLKSRVEQEWWWGDVVVAAATDWRVILRQAENDEECHGLYLLGIDSPYPAFCVHFGNGFDTTIWKANNYELHGWGFSLAEDDEWQITQNPAYDQTVAEIMKTVPDRLDKLESWQR